MMRFSKIVALVVAGLLLALQLYRPAKNNAPTGPDDLVVRYAPPPEVQRLLETSCYDCHSNRTRYPWYAEIQPAGWWLARHIRDGKRQLNFSEFGRYSARHQAQKLWAVSDEVLGRTMPLRSYTWAHHDARLSPAQIQLLGDWAEALADRIENER